MRLMSVKERLTRLRFLRLSQPHDGHSLLCLYALSWVWKLPLRILSNWIHCTEWYLVLKRFTAVIPILSHTIALSFASL